MNDNPHGWATATATAWQGNPGNLLPSKAEGWPVGSRRAATEAEEILSTAVAWWDTSRYRDGDRFLRNQGIAGELLNARLGSSIDPNSNDPLFLPVQDEGYMYVPGANAFSNNASTPDSAALSITGDFDIKIKASFASWSVQYLLSKEAAGNFSYRFYIQNSNLIVAVSTDGLVFQPSADSTTTLPFGPNDVGWIRVTMDADNGSSQRVTKFYTSTNGTTWTQLGTTVTQSGAVVINDNGVALTIGALASNNLLFSNGNFYRVIIQSAYDTANNTDSLVFDSDFTRLAGNTTSFNAIGDTGIKADGLVLKGRSGQYASTPDSAALDITGDIDLRVKITVGTVTVADRSLIGKFDNASNNSYWLRWEATNLRFFWSSSGTGSLNNTSAAHNLNVGDVKWVRVTLDVDDGAGNRVVTFFLSDDGATWTQLSQHTTAGTTSIFAGNQPVLIGAVGYSLGFPFIGTIHRAQILNGINGTTVFDADFDAQTPETVSFRAIGETGIKEDGLLLKGRSGEYASVPDSAPLKITGDIDIKVKVALTDWTPAGNMALISKWTTANNGLSYQMRVLNTGVLQLRWSNDGIAALATQSSVATGITDGATKWVRATLDVNDGAGNRVIKFYTSDDGTTWTQLGTTASGAGTTNISDGTAIFEVGSENVSTTSFVSGTISRVIIQSAFDTANNTSNLAFDADFEAQTIGATEFSESSANKLVVTINGTNPLVTINGTYPVVTINRSTTGRKTVIMPPRSLGGRSCFLFGTDDYMEVPGTSDGRNLRSPAQLLLQLQEYIGSPQPDLTLVFVGRFWGTNANSVIDRNATAAGTLTSASIGTTFGVSSGIPRLTMRSASTNFGLNGPTPTTGSTLCAACTITAANGGTGNNGPSTRTVYTNGVAGTTNNLVIGVFNDPAYPFWPFRIGASSNLSATPADMELYAVAVFRRVLTPAEINTICRYYGAI